MQSWKSISTDISMQKQQYKDLQCERELRLEWRWFSRDPDMWAGKLIKMNYAEAESQ